jgi:hypothetical protein
MDALFTRTAPRASVKSTCQRDALPRADYVRLRNAPLGRGSGPTGAARTTGGPVAVAATGSEIGRWRRNEAAPVLQAVAANEEPSRVGLGWVQVWV